MSKPKPWGQLRAFCVKAAKLGFAWDGYCGSGHPRFIHTATGATFTTSLTPSDWRSERNAIAEMERISGRKLERQNAGQYRYRSMAQTDMRMSDSERRVSAHVDRLLDRAARLRARWSELTNGCVDRSTAKSAREVIEDYEALRIELEQLHHTIPPITDAA
jgi:uncharacterized protein (DUF1778 family)